MTIVYCANRAIYHLLPTALNSLLSNNSNIKQIYLFIEDDLIDFISHPLIKFINVNNYPFIFKKGINCTKRFPYMAMVRCYLSKILSEDKVLYLDVDTTIDGDLTELWNINMSNNMIAGIKEDWKWDYYNSGVLLMNLKAIRESGLDDTLIDILQKCKMQFPDQDAMNFVFKRYKMPVDNKFNVLGRDEVYKQEIIVRHYAGIIKPWKEEASEKDIAFWKRYFTESINS